MAGWSILRNGSAVDCDDVTDMYVGSDCCSDVSHYMKDLRIDVHESGDDGEVKLRCLFDQVLSIFLNEAASRGCIRPIPALLSDGQPLDLFKLFLVVRKRGGFDLVNGFWAFVAKELGLDLGVSVSAKLIYFKYLYELERWLSRSFTEGRSENGELELEAKFKFLLFREFDRKRKSDRDASSEYKKNGKCIGMDVGKNQMGVLETKNVLKVCGASEVRNKHSDDDEKNCKNNKRYENNDDDGVILDPSACKQDSKSRKRKRESLSRMLEWISQIAKCPHDPSVGDIPPLSKWKDKKGNDLWVQAIRARGALLRKKWNHSNPEQPSLQNNQKIHPSMYDDVTIPSDRSTERLRCRGHVPSLANNNLRSCCNSCSSSQNKVIGSPKKEFDNGHKKQVVGPDNLSASSTTPKPSKDEHLQIHVSVGPRYQAMIPGWSGVASESDSKWLGTKIWPEKHGDHNSSADPVIGMGRPGLCDCNFPGSVECIRFHIAEKRMKLKLEIGHVFYRLRFDDMGEEVSLRWTAEEEQRFKDMVRFNPPSLGKCFWDHALKYFPRKTRNDLVSYYFNVFLVRRRSYQNRVTPKDIDSDDDESEFGCLSGIYGHHAVSVPGAITVSICLENKQCTDFE